MQSSTPLLRRGPRRRAARNDQQALRRRACRAQLPSRRASATDYGQDQSSESPRAQAHRVKALSSSPRVASRLCRCVKYRARRAVSRFGNASSVFASDRSTGPNTTLCRRVGLVAVSGTVGVMSFPATPRGGPVSSGEAGHLPSSRSRNARAEGASHLTLKTGLLLGSAPHEMPLNTAASLVQRSHRPPGRRFPRCPRPTPPPRRSFAAAFRRLRALLVGCDLITARARHTGVSRPAQ